MKAFKLDDVLPFGRSYYYEDEISSLKEFESDLRDDIEETLFFEGGRQAVDKRGVFVYQRNKRPQVALSKLFDIQLN